MNDMRRVVAAHKRMQAAYADDRLTSDSPRGDARALVVAAIWVESAEGLHGDAHADRLAELFPSRYGGKWQRIRDVIREDAPRWERADRTEGVRCEVIRPRGKPCGKRRVTGFRVTDWATGEWRMVGFCRDHRAEAAERHRVEQAEVAAHHGRYPEPMPNTGGVLPSHLPTWKWADLYAWADPLWKPPSVGLIAADWPVMARVAASRPPTLTMVAGAGAGVGEDVPRPPTLRVVGGDA